MSAPPSSAPPVPPTTFQTPNGTNSASPKDLRDFLQYLKNTNDDNAPSVLEKPHWLNLLAGLLDNVFGCFPYFKSTIRGTTNERIQLTDDTLDVFSCVSKRAEVDSFYVDEERLSKKIFVHLLGLCTSTESWLEVTSEGDSGCAPNTLYSKACETLVEFLQILSFSSAPGGDPGNAQWGVLQEILHEAIDLCSAIISAQYEPYPRDVHWFSTPPFLRITNGDCSIPCPRDTLNVIRLPSPSHLSVLASIIVDLFGKLCSSATLSSFVTAAMLRHTSELTRRVYDFCSECPTSPETRSRCLLRVVAAAHTLMRSDLSLIGGLSKLPCRLLIHRLQCGPNPEQRTLDRKLRDILTSNANLPVDYVSPALELLRSETWESSGNELRALAVVYIRGCASRLDAASSQAVQSFLQGNPSYPDLEPLLIIASNPIDSQLSHDADGIDTSHWRVTLQSLVSPLIMPDELQRNGIGHEDTAPYVRRVLDQLRSRWARGLHDSSSAARSALAENIASLASHLKLFSRQQSPPLRVAAALLLPLHRILEGPSTEVDVHVRRQAFRALRTIIREHSADIQSHEPSPVFDLLKRGFIDKDRSVKIDAGRALVDLVHLHANVVGMGCKHNEKIFMTINGLLDSSVKDAVKETLLIAIGSIGCNAQFELLGLVVHCLISQLGQDNHFLKGLAYTQLLEIAKKQRKSPYVLVSPYISQVASFVVSRKCTNPALIFETCRFLSVHPTDFISVTLSKTLPYLFVNCEGKVLEDISKELGKTTPSLFLNHSHEILAHVYQQHEAQTNGSLQFITNILSDAAAVDDIDIQSIVKSCVVPLLANLVVVLGDENEERAALAVDALRKVERSITGETPERILADIDLSPFLKTYMLGVVSNLNDMLQDVHGKKSVSAKKQILRGLEELIIQIGALIMATLQTMFLVPELAEVTLTTWYTFLSTLKVKDVVPYIGTTSAAIVSAWSALSPSARDSAKKCLRHIVFDVGSTVGNDAKEILDEVVDLGYIPELSEVHAQLQSVRIWDPRLQLQKILIRCSSNNITVAQVALGELQHFMRNNHASLIQSLATGDTFDLLIGKIQLTLFQIVSRDGEGSDTLRQLAFECMGILGAVDPDRCDLGSKETRMIVRSNFEDNKEAVSFARHLIQDVLVGAFRSTSDIKYQGHLAFTIQELLRFCKFTPALVSSGGTSSVSAYVRKSWDSFPKHVLETVTPLLGARFAAPHKELPQLPSPIYSHQKTYREWVQLWTAHLITKASGDTAQAIFGVFRSAVRNKDVGVAHHILPHLILNILASENDEDTNGILQELSAVLKDQVASDSPSTPDKKFLSAQAVFMLLDHLSGYVRILRQDTAKKSEGKRSRENLEFVRRQQQLIRVDSVLSSIDHELMAKAALQCRAYARSLMNFERQIVSMRERQPPPPGTDFTPYYERLHEIYAQLDEPDGMEGISTLILSPSLEHQIRQHESTGRWTAAQSCWEVRLQQQPDNLDFHLGLLRCLRNLGHYDTLRTHVQGVLVRNPGWESVLADFQVESAWMIGAWDDVHRIAANKEHESPSVVKARVLLAMRSGDPSPIDESLTRARLVLGAPIAASGARGYRRAYDALVDLHMIHELELIHEAISNLPPSSQGRRSAIMTLGQILSARLDRALPTFRIHESLLSMRRTAFSLSPVSRPSITSQIGQSWLASAKIARKVGQWQTAYSAMLQAQHTNARFSFIESAKLVRARGEPLRALQELENSMRIFGFVDNDTVDLTRDELSKRMKAKAQILLARWMNESDRYEASYVFKQFQNAAQSAPEWESAFYHLGHFQDQCYRNLSAEDKPSRGIRMNFQTIKCFTEAAAYGNKFVYQTIPRLLTLWLDMGERKAPAEHPLFVQVNDVVAGSIDGIPVYKWFTAFPQIVSRIGHPNRVVYSVLSKLISSVIREYPKQALWFFASVINSTKSTRKQRGRGILDQLKNNPARTDSNLPGLITSLHGMIDELLRLCNCPSDRKLSMRQDFPKLLGMKDCNILIPLQSSLTVNLPPVSSMNHRDKRHNIFDPSSPTFAEFHNEIEIMQSLAKPRKITVDGSDGIRYMFLGKPKDDLRKDARLMDFNGIINKLLKTNSESRRRQLRIRTYGVVALNEDCGVIQWVPNTVPVRPVLLKSYETRNIPPWSKELIDVTKRIKEGSDKDAAELFVTKLLPQFPPVFHEWFVETFPEPSVWLASRLNYGRTLAVMSMVGFILGLGDRHCENILLDTITGDVVHVDFSCLFEKGKTLETPERVPFRLTQNLVDGLGVTGIEGVFRVACEITMQLLRDNKDPLMSVLDAFIHDPLVEWEDDRRKMQRRQAQEKDKVNAAVKAPPDLRGWAKSALKPIEEKLKGLYSATNVKERTYGGITRGGDDKREISTSNLVQMLIQEAMDSANLAKMYPGWAAWH
ncbi:uncharacterized protein EDB91DRAFT_1243215 [Suillus paluster]|uniref:uncharacterized protein n=1 Tax=Suillus paluster TaxID=48578 RepID=UPI001B87B620|nr:uncharacterized protein EDB91DRAFT_1243215 [Suillus paluster]KAG1752448.1 hypothetical protein EDB91DRAFT_1243215 [Suillus paluster]